MTLRERPLPMRPRERLVAAGAAGLSDSELVAVLLRTGRHGASAIELAEQVLARVGGLRGLMSAASHELSSVRGVGPAKTAQLLAAVELARRLVRTATFPERPQIQSASDVFDLVGLELASADREQFVVLLLDTRHRVLRACRVSVGELRQTPAHPREVFKQAILHSSATVVLVHNHPSGDPTPSDEDVQLTGRLVAAGALLGIEVLDHVVVGHGRYASMREMGLLTLRQPPAP